MVTVPDSIYTGAPVIIVLLSGVEPVITTFPETGGRVGVVPVMTTVSGTGGRVGVVPIMTTVSETGGSVGVEPVITTVAIGVDTGGDVIVVTVGGDADMIVSSVGTFGRVGAVGTSTVVLWLLTVGEVGAKYKLRKTSKLSINVGIVPTMVGIKPPFSSAWATLGRLLG
jgi:hypothetical protein